jgi:hypothetical protein
MYAAGVATTPDLGETVRRHARAVKEALGAWHAGYDYYNFLESSAGAAPYFRPTLPPSPRDQGNLRPDQAIVSAHPVPPAATDRGIDGVGNELDVHR